MKIYLVGTNNYVGYDDYDAIVVIAKDKRQAKEIAKQQCNNFDNNLSISEIGIAHENQPIGKVLASFNAG